MLENKIGLEFEGVVLGENDRLIKNVDSLNIFDSNNVGKETTKDRLELRTDPHNSVSDAFKEFLQLMDSYDLIKTKTFLPFNHDGNKKKVVFRDDSLAVVKKLFLGEDYSFEGLTRGFHIHFSLPDDEEKII